MRTPLLALLLLANSLAARAGEAPRRRVLLLGDSHTVGPFGVALDGLLRKANGPEVATHAVCSASVRWWQSKKRRKLSVCHFQRPFGSKASPVNGAYQTEPPDLEALLALQPDVVIVALGSNPDGNSMDDTITAASNLLERLGPKTSCYWVGPPPMPSRLDAIGQFYDQFSQAVYRSGHGCVLIDSRGFLKPEQSTKDHFYGKPAQDWAAGVFALIP